VTVAASAEVVEASEVATGTAEARAIMEEAVAAVMADRRATAEVEVATEVVVSAVVTVTRPALLETPGGNRVSGLARRRACSILPRRRCARS